MYRPVRLLHLLGFAMLFGGLIAVGAVDAPIERIGPLLGLGVVLAALTGIGMIAVTRGRAFKPAWVKAHLIAAVLLGPALYLVHKRASADHGVAAWCAVVLAVIVVTLASLKPSFAKKRSL